MVAEVESVFVPEGTMPDREIFVQRFDAPYYRARCRFCAWSGEVRAYPEHSHDDLKTHVSLTEHSERVLRQVVAERERQAGYSPMGF